MTRLTVEYEKKNIKPYIVFRMSRHIPIVNQIYLFSESLTELEASYTEPTSLSILISQWNALSLSLFNLPTIIYLSLSTVSWRSSSNNSDTFTGDPQVISYNGRVGISLFRLYPTVICKFMLFFLFVPNLSAFQINKRYVKIKSYFKLIVCGLNKGYNQKG